MPAVPLTSLVLQRLACLPGLPMTPPKNQNLPGAWSGHPEVEVGDWSCIWRTFRQALVSATAHMRSWELE